MNIPQTDIIVVNQGSVFLFLPQTEAGKDWLQNNVQAESWQWFGPALSVDHRYAQDLALAAQCDGLEVQ